MLAPILKNPLPEFSVLKRIKNKALSVYTAVIRNDRIQFLFPFIKFVFSIANTKNYHCQERAHRFNAETSRLPLGRIVLVASSHLRLHPSSTASSTWSIGLLREPSRTIHSLPEGLVFHTKDTVPPPDSSFFRYFVVVAFSKYRSHCFFVFCVPFSYFSFAKRFILQK